MPARSTRILPDAVILALAKRQHGVVERQQLLESGLSRAQIESRIASGRLIPLHRGVYFVGAVPSEWAYSQAALLALGSRSVLSHRSAASIWDLWPYPSTAYPWVTIPHSVRLERPKIVVRRASLEPGDVRVRHRMRLTGPPRTVFDCASLLPDPYELEAVVAEAHFRRLASEVELRYEIDRNPGRPGIRALRAVLDMDGGPQRTRSGGERWFLRLLRENGIAGFQTNQFVHGKEVDFFWRDLNFCVELDGWDGHSSRRAFERDRVKWAHLQANGVDVMPVATRQAQRDVSGTLLRLRQALSRSRTA